MSLLLSSTNKQSKCDKRVYRHIIVIGVRTIQYSFLRLQVPDTNLQYHWLPLKSNTENQY